MSGPVDQGDSERDASTYAVITEHLRRAGCVAAEEEAAELMERAQGSRETLDALLARRVEGEPLAWLVGSVQFCGVSVVVQRGVYVPRWQSEQMAVAAADLLPEDGIAVDLCTGSGAVARVLAVRRPEARVVATEIDPTALRCARRNGVEVYEGDMAQSLPVHFRGRVDVVTAVVPYVPTNELRLLPRDILRYEPRLALDGGPDGMTLIKRAAKEAATLLRPGGSLLLELGGDEGELLVPVLAALDYRDIAYLIDDEGDVRGLVCRRFGSTEPVV